MIAVARTSVPATRRRPMVVSIVTTVVTTVVATTAVPGRAEHDVVVTTVVPRTETVAIAETRVVVTTTRLHDSRCFRAVIRIAAPGTATDVSGVVITTSKRQDRRSSQKQ
jgi:hypothetical protein